MTRSPAAGRRRRPTAQGTVLSRELIIDRALHLLRVRGSEALTARKLASVLGADPSALYRHFASMDDLVLAVGDRIIGEALARWHPQSNWQESLAALARSFYHAYVDDFPAAGRLVAHRSTRGENEQRAVETISLLLREGGFDVRAAYARTAALVDLVLGFASLDAGFARLPLAQQQRDAVAWTAYGGGTADPWESSFEVALAIMLRGLRSDPRPGSTSGG